MHGLPLVRRLIKPGCALDSTLSARYGKRARARKRAAPTRGRNQYPGSFSLVLGADSTISAVIADAIGGLRIRCREPGLISQAQTQQKGQQRAT
jgi:hypothetical protein